MTTLEELTPAVAWAYGAQTVLLLTGAVVLWRVQFGAAARDGRATRLAPWAIGGFEFTLLAGIVVVAAVIGQVVFTAGLHAWRGPLEGDLQLVTAGAALQAGLLIGVWIARHAVPRRPVGPPPLDPPNPPAAAGPVESSAPPRPAGPGPIAAPAHPPAPIRGGLVVRAGIATFFAALPVLTLVSAPWTLLLERAGFSTDRQELVEMFARAESPLFLGVVTLLAILVAPVAEELVFRAGLFRFLRTRVPRPIAFAVPAVLFAMLHGNFVAFLPLALLGVIFSLAYERTGRIVVPMIAHGLFNLNTILLLLAGVTA